MLFCNVISERSKFASCNFSVLLGTMDLEAYQLASSFFLLFLSGSSLMSV
jgi:hypothetical protein